MIGLFKSRRKTLIGMDIGSNVVKCIRLSAETDRPSITHFAMVPLPPEAIVDGEIMDRELVIQAVTDCAEQAGLPDRLLCNCRALAIGEPSIELPDPPEYALSIL